VSFPFSVIRKADAQLRRVGAEVPDGYFDIPLETKQEEWNGIGSDKGYLKCLVMPANFLLPWMLAASLPHDILWGIRNDGTRETFERSNAEWKHNCYRLADDSLGWVWPKMLRETIRNSRKFEARQGWKILMSDKCWDVFQASAQIANEGPERSEP
jgi:hypothetical protein